MPPQPCIITIAGNGPSPLGGSVTSTSIGTPSKLGNALRVVRGRAEEHAVLGSAGVSEGIGRGGLGRARHGQERGGGDEKLLHEAEQSSWR